jgi:hypothetical protein
MTTANPIYSYIILFILSILSFVLFLSASMILKISTPYTHLLAALITVSLGFTFAFLWPNGIWRWVILASSGFWMYFLAVFAISLLRHNAEWFAIGEALAVIAIASIGAGIGRHFSLARRTQIS